MDKLTAMEKLNVMGAVIFITFIIIEIVASVIKKKR